MGRRTRWEPAEGLAALEYFGRLPRPLLRVAGQHAEWSAVIAGTRLQRQDAHAGHVWLPLDGGLDLLLDDVVVGHVGRGAVAGEASVLRGGRAEHEIVAASDTALVSLPARAFHGLLGDERFAAEVRGRQVVAPLLLDARPIEDQRQRSDQVSPAGMLST